MKKRIFIPTGGSKNFLEKIVSETSHEDNKN